MGRSTSSPSCMAEGGTCFSCRRLPSHPHRLFKRTDTSTRSVLKFSTPSRMMSNYSIHLVCPSQPTADFACFLKQVRAPPLFYWILQSSFNSLCRNNMRSNPLYPSRGKTQFDQKRKRANLMQPYNVQADTRNIRTSWNTNAHFWLIFLTQNKRPFISQKKKKRKKNKNCDI